MALIYSLAKNPLVHWSTIPDYIFRPLILEGALRTLELTFIAMVIGIAGGTVLAVMRLSKNYVLSWLSWLYIWFFRGTPVFVQILIWGYLGPLSRPVPRSAFHRRGIRRTAWRPIASSAAS